MKKLLFSTLFLFSMILTAQQESKKIDLKQGSVGEKFDVLYKKSGKYKQYKVVEHGLLLELKQQVLDTLKKQKKLTAEANSQIADLQQKLTALQKDLSANQQKITELTDEKQSIGFLGMNVDKEKFKLMMGLIFLGLLLALLYFIYAYRNSIALTREAKNNLARIEEEYYSFKTNALEREQLLKRQLLDEQKKHQN